MVSWIIYKSGFPDVEHFLHLINMQLGLIQSFIKLNILLYVQLILLLHYINHALLFRKSLLSLLHFYYSSFM